MTLSAVAVDWTAGRSRILDEVGVDVVPGELLGLLGPNGSGKSSLLRILAGVRAPSSGDVRLDGTALRSLRGRDRARRIAMLPQETADGAELTALEVALLGRTPHGSALRGASRDDEAIARDALERFGVGAHADRRWPTLSGGERQRVLLARTLAQGTDILLLDEFTNHLDIRHQLDALDLLAASGRTVVAALHDLQLAAWYCDRIVLLAGGRVVAAGSPGEVLTAARILDVYGARAEVDLDDEGRPAIRFRRGAAAAAHAPASDTEGARP